MWQPYVQPNLETVKCQFWKVIIIIPCFAIIGTRKFCHLWQLSYSCHFWQFLKLPFLATAQSCHIWQLYKAAIFGNFTKLPYVATICAAKFGNSYKYQLILANYWKSQEFHALAIIGTPSCFKKCLSQATFQNWYKFPFPFIVTF